MRSKIQAGLVLHDSNLTRLENLCYSSHLHGNFQFNAIWHQWSVATCTLCKTSRKWCHCHSITHIYGL